VGHGRFETHVAQLVSLAVDEAVANVMEHAYGNYEAQANQEIQIILDVNPNRLEILIRDRGRAFDPDLIAQVDIREHVRKGEKGGLGIYLMRKIMDEVNYSFKQGMHNELQMIKYVDNRP